MTARPLYPFVSRLQFVHKETGLLTPATEDNLTPPQLMILDSIEKAMIGGEVRVVGGTRTLAPNSPYRAIILKARQMGVSTITEGTIFAISQLIANSRSLIVSHDLDSSRHLLDMTRRYWETSWICKEGIHTPRNAAQGVLSWHEPDSMIRVTTAKNAASARSHTLRAVHASEVAFWDNAKELMKGLAQSVPRSPKTFIFMESTANGVGNYFQETWDAAVDGENFYLPLFYAWWQHPGYEAQHIGLAHMLDRPLRNLTSDERALVKGFRRLGVDESRIKAKLIWRREILATECFGDIDTLRQEYPSCLVAGTRVSMDRGVIPIEEVESGDLHPNGLVEKVVEQPPVRCVRVTTRNGRQADCTWHHPFVDSTGVLIPAASSLGRTLQPSRPELSRVDRRVGWTRHGCIGLSIDVTPEVARFLGYYMGDGSFSNNTLSIACDAQDRDVIDEVKGLFGLFELTPGERVVGSKGGGVEIRAGSTGLREMFMDLGWVRSRESDQAVVRNVHVPEVIWRSSFPVVREFLSALFEADGFSNRAQWDVRLFTRYEQFARDIALLIDACGGHARAYKSQTGWTVGMTSSDAKWFHDAIGFRSARKKAAVPSYQPQRPRANGWEVVSVEEIGDLPTFDLSILGRPYFDANGLLSHNTPDEAFIASGRNVFPRQHLDAAYEPMEGETGMLVAKAGRVEFVADRLGGKLTVFRHPSPSSWYAIGGDAAKQAKGDYAVASVLDRSTWEQVAEFRDDVDPITFAEQLILLGHYYNEALLVPETNMSGGVVAEMARANYDNLYIHQAMATVRGQMANQYGFNTNTQTKPEVIGNLKRALVDRFAGNSTITFHSKHLYREMRGYVLEDGKYQNSSNPDEADHDDTVMAFGLALIGAIHDADNDDRRPMPSMGRRQSSARPADEVEMGARRIAAMMDVTPALPTIKPAEGSEWADEWPDDEPAKDSVLASRVTRRPARSRFESDLDGTYEPWGD